MVSRVPKPSCQADQSGRPIDSGNALGGKWQFWTSWTRSSSLTQRSQENHLLQLDEEPIVEEPYVRMVNAEQNIFDMTYSD